MLDNDNLTYKKKVVGNAAARQAERTPLSLERSQKLDLLIHLLANLRQALIICGPEGIGKTTLLQILQDKRKDQWQICLLQGSSALSFEAIINNLSRFLNLGGSGFELSTLRAYCEKQKVVLIIDDAGELVPGLIGELVDLADSVSGLRLVFSMTYDEFHIKSTSDKAVEDCHFIELPPLNQKQCAEYLQNLSAQPGAMVSFNAVTDSLVEDLYRETHGIPGKILAEIPKLNQYQNRKKGRLGLWLGVAVIVLATGWIMKALLSSMPPSEIKSEKRPETPTPSVVQQPITPQVAEVNKDIQGLELPAPYTLPERNQALPAQPEPAKPGILETPAPTPAAKQPPVPTKIPEAAVAVTPKQLTPEASATPPTAQTLEQPVAKTEVPAAVTQPSEAKQPEAPVATAIPTPEQKPATPASDLDWIMAQPANNYTIQLMVLSSKDAVNRFLKKYAEYRDNLKYYTITQNNQEKYVLIYGSFQSPGDAIKRKSTMPEEFNNGMEKRFKGIQKESRR